MMMASDTTTTSAATESITLEKEIKEITLDNGPRVDAECSTATPVCTDCLAC